MEDSGIWFEDGAGIVIGWGGMWGEDRKGNPVLLHRFPICPVEIIRSTSADGQEEEFVKVKFMTASKQEKTAIVTTHDLKAFNASNPIVRAGWVPPAQTASGKVSDCLQAALFGSDLPTKQGYSQAGWNNETIHVCPGHELFTGQSAKMLEVKGDYAAWKAAVLQLCTDSPACALAMAQAFGGFLRGVVPLRSGHSAFMYLHGEKSRGKSTILEVVASIRGPASKGGNMLDSHSSKVGVEGFFSAANHSFFTIDELDDILREMGGVSKLMFFSNGGGRAKGDGQGSVTVGKTWNLTAIASGNVALSSLSRDDMKAEALGSRVFELDIMDNEIHTFRKLKELDPAKTTLKSNYGHGYALAIDYIATHRAELIENYNTFYEELTSDYALRHFDKEKRLAEFVCLGSVGAKLLGVIVGKEAEITALSALDCVIGRYKYEEEEQTDDEELRALGMLDTLKNFVADNAARFRWEGYAFSATQTKEAQQQEANNLTLESIRGGALGVVKTVRIMSGRADIEGEILLNPKGEELLQKFAGLSSHELMNAAKKIGALKTNDEQNKSKLGKTRRESLGVARALCIEIKPGLKIQQQQILPLLAFDELEIPFSFDSIKSFREWDEHNETLPINPED